MFFKSLPMRDLRIFLFGIVLSLSFFHGEMSAQIVTTSPTFPKTDQPVTIVFDAKQGTGGLVGVSRVFMHAGVILTGSTGTDWQHVVGTWGSPTSTGEMTSLGNDKWSITITPRTYFQAAGLPANATVYRIGMVFREAGPCGGFNGASGNCKEGKETGGENIYVNLHQGGFELRLITPTQSSLFVNNSDVINISAAASESSTLKIEVNGSVKKTVAATTEISYDHTVSETGVVNVKVTANNGTTTLTEDFSYIVRATTVLAPRPAGVIDGINYSADKTKVTLSLWAPTKMEATSSIYVVGDFTGWKVLPAYQMKRDGEHYWLQISGLTPGAEYAFQYLIDESIWIADPYADKILDPDDQYIPAKAYPGLKAYPAEADHHVGYFNKLSVFQTDQVPYDWQVENFTKPAREELVVYELLVRDFFGDGERNYQNLIDTIGYFKRLGVNAIELMPITEYSGNESWGYNPTFMFAPDKYYGTKNKLKEFIDVCHQNGIAVILDLVMNQQDIPNSYLMMDFDFSTFKPKASNKWFNPNDRHPYAVFFDVNHESTYTQTYLDSITHYWLNEYKMDGYRFDLAKGFTQNVKCGGSTTDEGCFASKDDSRIAILKRMSDAIWSHNPDAYVILELFADNNEEKELVEYRANEGKGMMVWGNINYSYAQNTMGQSSGADVNWISYKSRGWSVPHAVGYMESHDEERMMYRNLNFGGSSGSYSVRTLGTALDRAKAAAAVFFTVPGPKMLWQFGELGYDISIDFNGRVSPKPVKWEYYSNEQRHKLMETYAELIKLKTSYDVFNTADFTFQGTSLVKQLLLKNQPYTNTPASAEEMNVVVFANFNLTSTEAIITFPHAGNWFQYFSDGSLEVNALLHTITLQPGEFRIYTDVKLGATTPELNPFVTPLTPELLSVTESNSKVVLTWKDNSSIETGYRIYRKIEGGEYSLITTLAKSITTYSDNAGLLPETNYEYYVEAINGVGASASETMTITTSADLITDNERELELSIGIYPNPVNNILAIRSANNTIEEIRIVSIAGGIQKLKRISAETWDLQNISRGLHVLEIKTKKGVVRKKIVKE